MKTIDIFISHSWTYDKHRANLTSLLNQSKYFYWKDYSVPPHDPLHTNGTDKDLRGAIKEQIRQSSIVIILAGVYATYSKWINMEIEIAKEDFHSQKPILAVEPLGSERTSQKVKENAQKIVKWNTESIVTAIRDLT